MLCSTENIHTLLLHFKENKACTTRHKNLYRTVRKNEIFLHSSLRNLFERIVENYFIGNTITSWQKRIQLSHCKEESLVNLQRQRMSHRSEHTHYFCRYKQTATFKVCKKSLRVPPSGPLTIVAMASLSRHGSSSNYHHCDVCQKERLLTYTRLVGLLPDGVQDVNP